MSEEKPSGLTRICVLGIFIIHNAPPNPCLAGGEEAGEEGQVSARAEEHVYMGAEGAGNLRRLPREIQRSGFKGSPSWLRSGETK